MFVQVSPFSKLPSSHCSHGFTMPLPQVSTMRQRQTPGTPMLDRLTTFKMSR